MQRYPTFSARGHLPHRLADSYSDSSSSSINASSCSEVGSLHDECCTHQANISHLPTSSSTGELQVNNGAVISPFAESVYVPVSMSSSKSQSISDRSQYISSCRSHAATFQHYESRVCHSRTSHTLSSNFYSTSSHYNTRSVLTMPASTAANSYHVPCRPSAVSATTSHSITATQHRQNVIEISKPFESSDVLRYSEKLRQQRLNNSAMAAAEFFNLSH